jgi:predicted O-methyltransferase YrrM
MKTFEEIFDYVKKCGCSVQYDAAPYCIQQVPEEISALLLELLKKNGYSNFLEVGSAAGGLSRLFNDFFHFKKMVILDNNHYKKLVEIRKKQLAGLPVVEFIGNSQSPEAKNFVKNINTQFDIVFIDSGHSYHGVKNDYNNFSEFLKKDGYLIFHDTDSYPEVGRFVDELKLDKNLAFIDDYRGGKEKTCGLALFKKITPQTIHANTDALSHIVSKFKIDLSEPSPIYIAGSRLDFPPLFKELGFTTGAEIGVLRGDFSEILCQSNPNLKLYSIDAWTFYPTHNNFRKQRHLDQAYEMTKKRLSAYPNNTIIKKWSMDAVIDFPDESLDFVFIDANHEFRYITDDIAEWSKKVKKGGIVSGHDYGRSHDRQFGNVKDVVLAWTSAKLISPWFVFETPEYMNKRESPDYRDTSWMWVKL